MYVLLIAALLMAGCSGTRAWLAGYDESAVRASCEASKVNQRSGKYDIDLKKFIYTPYPEAHVQKAIERCIDQSRNLALMTSVPVVFTIPLIP